MEVIPWIRKILESLEDLPKAREYFARGKVPAKHMTHFAAMKRDKIE